MKLDVRPGRRVQIGPALEGFWAPCCRGPDSGVRQGTWVTVGRCSGINSAKTRRLIYSHICHGRLVISWLARFLSGTVYGSLCGRAGKWYAPWQRCSWTCKSVQHVMLRTDIRQATFSVLLFRRRLCVRKPGHCETVMSMRQWETMHTKMSARCK